MLYYFNQQSFIENLPLPFELKIVESDDALFLSLLVGIPVRETARRLANDNKAYVAYYNNIPAAFGWMAMGKAKIGELNHEVILPLNHRYLWNFRTLEAFRGRGIYPRLLQHILRTEGPESDCFWILHAPENGASKKGILKAGFTFAGHVSILPSDKVIFNSSDERDFDTADIAEIMGFYQSTQEQATCWSCSSVYLVHKKEMCCCSQSSKECNQELFATA